MRGRYIDPIGDDDKQNFLDFIARGLTRPEAAEATGPNFNARQFRALCSPKSHTYDPEFAAEYERLTAPDGEQEEGLLERLEEAAVTRAIRSSDRLLEKLLINKSPEWAVHRPQSMQINFNKTEQLAVILPELSDEELLQLRQRIESNMKQLPPGPPDIDAA